jgi:hypothetical protein
VFVPTLGSDEIFQFTFDSKTRHRASNAPAVFLTKPGLGPRHFITSSDNNVYLLRAGQEISESTFERVEYGFTTDRFCIPYVVVVIDVEPIRERFSTVAPFLDERGRRLVAAAEAFAAGYGGIAAVAMATGMAPSTIGRGLKELAQDEPRIGFGVRTQAGDNQEPALAKAGDPTLVADLEALVEPTTRGIRNRRCGGPARVCADWPRRCTSGATR